jgi:D-amino peptidase
VAAALRSGADEVIVCDTHHGGGNLPLEEMPADPRVTYHGRSRGLHDGEVRLMPGLDESVDGLMLMGHHAKAGTADASLPHSNNLDWADVRINGRSVGELGLEACYAAHWDVPVILVQGEEAACREAEALFPGVVTAPVKRALARDLCTGPDAGTARELTARKVGEAIARARTCARPAPYRPALPLVLAIRMRSVEEADRAARQPGVRRVDPFTVERRIERYRDILS